MQAIDQLQRLFVGAEQYVLTVVEQLAFEIDRACASAEHAAGLVEGNAHPGFGQRQRGGAAGPAAADDCHTRVHGNSQVLLASHSLRNGVSATRARKTGNPAQRISSSRVR